VQIREQDLPSRIRPYSAAIGSFTFSTMSDRSHTSSTDALCAPTRVYASSGNALPTPASASIRTSVPVVDQLERAGRRQRDAILVRFDLPGDADPHCGGSLAILLEV